MSIKIEKDGTFTLEPNGQDTLECFEELKALIKKYDAADALYALTYTQISLAFGSQLRMDADTFEKFLGIICDHLSGAVKA